MVFKGEKNQPNNQNKTATKKPNQPTKTHTHPKPQILKQKISMQDSFVVLLQ